MKFKGPAASPVWHKYRRQLLIVLLVAVTIGAAFLIQEVLLLDNSGPAPSTFKNIKIKQEVKRTAAIESERDSSIFDEYDQVEPEALTSNEESQDALLQAEELSANDESDESVEQAEEGSEYQEDQEEKSLDDDNLGDEGGVAGEKVEYIEKDTNVIDPDFKGTKRIIVDASFHYYHDRYGLTDPDFNLTQMEDVLKDVVRTWMKANIWIRFKRLPKQGEHIRDEAADAMRWWVFGYKNIEANATRFWQDVDYFLVKGVSKMTKQYAENEVLRRHKEYNGHSLMNWVLNLGPNKQSRTVRIDINTVGFWPWYNGGASRGRIFVRSGSCRRDAKARAGISPDDTLHRVCNGWGEHHKDTSEMTTTEMARIIAHEFGHLFGLPHPEKGACQYAKRIEELSLMAQQRSVALVGTQCSETNRVGRYARYLTKAEMTRARAVAGAIMQEQQRRARQREEEKEADSTPLRKSPPPPKPSSFKVANDGWSNDD